MQERQCRTCKEYFTLDNKHFYTKHDGQFLNQCKKCHKEISKVAKEANRERLEKIKATSNKIIGDFKLGSKYRVTNVNRGNKNNDRFTGKVIQHDKRLLTLESDKGIRETFLKVDFVIGEYGIKAI